MVVTPRLINIRKNSILHTLAHFSIVRRPGYTINAKSRPSSEISLKGISSFFEIYPKKEKIVTAARRDVRAKIIGIQMQD